MSINKKVFFIAFFFAFILMSIIILEISICKLKGRVIELEQRVHAIEILDIKQ